MATAARRRSRSHRSKRSPKKRTARRPALSRPSRRTAGQALAPDAGVRPLDFEAGDDRSGRAGDRRSLEQQRNDFPRSRVQEAGLTAGETTHPDRNTADDLAPDTMLDEEGDSAPADQRGPIAADAALSVTDESGIGEGGGRDEAEDARREPIGRAELRRIRRRVARSATSVNDVEPNEASAGRPGHERNENEGGSS